MERSKEKFIKDLNCLIEEYGYTLHTYNDPIMLIPTEDTLRPFIYIQNSDLTHQHWFNLIKVSKP